MAEKSKITVLLDDEQFEFELDENGDVILDAAIDAGADAPFSCKGGICTTCMAKVLEGTVKMSANFALTDAEINDGYILTCQSHPTSAVVKISYDE
ncbi:MAG: 2Fe-2S iron-sulfur cluster binding domain-containing protein [Flavobacteriales bacterium]|nr:2Fe-2S iron-sulfur cluster binding domain-containing protein [Flavobacteriales bacterium]